MSSSNGQRDVAVRIIERIVVLPPERRSPAPLVITFTTRTSGAGAPAASHTPGRAT